MNMRNDEQRVTLRIPLSVYRRLQAVQKQRSHLSMNALIVEAITDGIQKAQESCK